MSWIKACRLSLWGDKKVLPGPHQPEARRLTGFKKAQKFSPNLVPEKSEEPEVLKMKRFQALDCLRYTQLFKP